jgi:hypothetical protein
MLNLKVSAAKTHLADQSCEKLAERESWLDTSRHHWASSWSHGPDHYVHLPSGVVFHATDGSAEVTVNYPHGLDQQQVVETFVRHVRPCIAQALGWEALHASAVLSGRGVTAFCGSTMTGKSTLAYGLSRRGYTLCADDSVTLDLSADLSPTAALWPFRIYLRPLAAAYFDWQRAPLADCSQPSVRKGEPLNSIVILERSVSPAECSPVEILRLPPVQAFRALLSYAYCFSLRDIKRRRRMLKSYLELAGHAPVYRVRFRAGFEEFPQVLDQIESLL